MNAESPTILTTPKLAIRTVIRGVFLLAAWGCALFVAHGTAYWPRAWIHVGLWAATFAVNLGVLFRLNPDVIEARLNRKPTTARFEPVILALFVVIVVLVPIVAGLDVGHYGWLVLPFWTVWPGVVLHVLGAVILLWAMAVNPFLEQVVRIQTERGHRVVTTGPYAIVRHPMYVGIILALGGVPLVLGSGAAIGPIAAIAVLLTIRTSLEDRFLRAGLPGYETYTRQTRFRLVPGVW